MRCYQFTVVLFISLIIWSCKRESELTSISYDEMVELMTTNSITIPKDIPYYSLEGELLTAEERTDLTNDLPYANWMINEDTVLIKVLLRDPATVRIAQKTTPLIQNGTDDIDCDKLKDLLQVIYERDQDSRIDNLNVDSIDQNNLAIIEKVIEKCGFPTLESAGENGHTAIWLVIQHASADKRKQYFPMFLEAANKGFLEQQDIALMEDRMLMDDGKPQLYGSQVFMNTDGTYELYELQEPEKVDSRRRLKEMGTLKEYLSFFNIEFKIKQVE